MAWSQYQEAVFDFAVQGKGHGTVEAVSGSGKSTTGIEMVQRFPSVEEGLFTSFTKNTVQDLTEKILAKNIKNVKAKTYNSFGAGLVFKNLRPAPTLVQNKTEVILQYDVLNLDNDDDRKSFYACRYGITKLVGLFKALGLQTTSEADQKFQEIVEYYDVELPKDKRFFELLMAVWNISLRRFDIIDFQDQVMLPVLKDWVVPQVDFLVIDEYQDTCPFEAALMLRACKTGRVIVFGDSWQAIYSFKGTKPDSMADFTREFGAQRLPLSISYRCSQAVVAEAQKIVSHIEPSPTAKAGSVGWRKKEEFVRKVGPNDMVLARCTDDLVKSVLEFLKEGRAAFVLGREFGTQLKYFVEKVAGGDDGMNAERFIELVGAKFNEEYPMLLKQGKESQAVGLESKVESLYVLIVGCSVVGDLKRRIDSIFTDGGLGIRHMTIHKAKGLENDHVWILRPDKMPHKRVKKQHLLLEEERLRYVAITRSKDSLTYVEKGKEER